jgi:hypothetical protein
MALYTLTALILLLANPCKERHVVGICCRTLCSVLLGVLRLFALHPGRVLLVDWADCLPHCTVALKPAAKGNLPYLVPAANPLLGLNLCQDVPTSKCICLSCQSCLETSGCMSTAASRSGNKLLEQTVGQQAPKPSKVLEGAYGASTDQQHASTGSAS